MVAAMPLYEAKTTKEKTVTSNDLRNLALCLAGALALLVVASQMVDSGSASASDELDDLSAKRFVDEIC